MSGQGYDKRLGLVEVLEAHHVVVDFAHLTEVVDLVRLDLETHRSHVLVVTDLVIIEVGEASEDLAVVPKHTPAGARAVRLTVVQAVELSEAHKQ